MKRHAHYRVICEWVVEVEDPKTQDARDAADLVVKKWCLVVPDQFKVRPVAMPRKPAGAQEE